MKTKILLEILCVVLCLSLAGCVTASKVKPETPTQPVAGQENEILVTDQTIEQQGEAEVSKPTVDQEGEGKTSAPSVDGNNDLPTSSPSVGGDNETAPSKPTASKVEEIVVSVPGEVDDGENPSSQVPSTVTPSSGSTVSQPSADVPSSQGVTLSLEEVQATKGSTFTVAANITADSSLAAVDFEIDYDPDLISYVSYEKGNAVGAGMCDGNEVSSGKFHFTMITLSELKKAGSMFVVTFKVADNAPAGKIPLTLTCQTSCDFDINSIPVTCVSGSVTVK